MPPNTAAAESVTTTTVLTILDNNIDIISMYDDDEAPPSLGNPQMPASCVGSPTIAKATTAAAKDDVDYNVVPAPFVSLSQEKQQQQLQRKLSFHRSKSWRAVSTEPHFNIGILIGSTSVKDRHVSAISKPASQCTLTHLVVLHPIQGEDLCVSVDDWLTSNKIGNGHGCKYADGDGADRDDDQRKRKGNDNGHGIIFDDGFGGVEHVGIDHGDDGWKRMLQSSDIDAVYIVLPPSYQKDYVIAALKAGKHVLVNDPISTPLLEFKEELDTAKQYGKFIQSSTMFVHQYRVQRFLNRVLQDDNFGHISAVDASIQLCYQDVEKVGVKLPLRRQDGCIRVLGRYCVLVSTLFFHRLGSFAESVSVLSFKVDEQKGTILSAECVVKYTQGRQLHFYVAYIPSATRQSIELKATTRYATMNDFVIEHPDGLATYRVYDRVAASDGNIHVSSGDSIDVAMGMGQERVMWRSFVNLSNRLDQRGGWDDSEATAECRELTNVALQTKKILIALMESLEKGELGVEVPICTDDCEHV